MALWCSDTRDLRSRLVCPIYMNLQSLQGTWYTKQDFSSATKGSFREERNLPMVSKGCIFTVIRREYDKNIRNTARKLVKVNSKITKLLCHLNFNHNCLQENLLPKSLRFAPPIRTTRGYRPARKHGFEFLKLRITENHLSLKKNKAIS